MTQNIPRPPRDKGNPYPTLEESDWNARKYFESIVRWARDNKKKAREMEQNLPEIEKTLKDLMKEQKSGKSIAPMVPKSKPQPGGKKQYQLPGVYIDPETGAVLREAAKGGKVYGNSTRKSKYSTG